MNQKWEIGPVKLADGTEAYIDYVQPESKHYRYIGRAKDSDDVHHIVPFHQRPDLELVEDNLITLCREHHFRIGHDPDGRGPRKPSWLESNPNVRQDAKNWSKR